MILATADATAQGVGAGTQAPHIVTVVRDLRHALLEGDLEAFGGRP